MSLLFSFLGRFPLNVLHALGALLGWFTWLVSPTYRRRMRDNMRQAGLAAAGAAAIAEAGKSLLELPFIWGRPVAEVLASVHQVCGMEILQEAQKQGHPILFLTPHLGCFEVLGPFLGSRRPLTALYRPSKLAWVEECIRKGRGRFVTLASADRSGVRLLLAAIKRKEAVILLPDQVPGKGEGIWAPFFGRPAFTMTLAARLTEIEGVVPILAFAERLHYGAGYRLHFLALSKPLTGDLGTRVAQLNSEIEAMIRRYPEQYLWSYNRHKRPSGSPALR
ncbi:MAG: lysophospholipid acyltransferase family protein [Rhodocyclales bacterium]|nr:lysophospholipid acyltransferase family protein [Rhodocyclales bacterium]